MRSRLACTAYLAALGALFSAAPLFAADRTWTNPLGGAFSTPANWLNNAPPGTGDTATFNLNTSYTVNLAAPATLTQFFVDHDTLTLNLGGSTLTTTTTLFALPSLTVGESAGANGVLLLENGTFVAPNVRVADFGNGTLTLMNASVNSSDTLYAGFRAGSSGVVNLTSAGAVYSAVTEEIGYNGNGLLNISGGGSLISTDAGSGANGDIGNAVTGHGTVTLSGLGSSWKGVRAYVDVGLDGQGYLSVTNDALLSVQQMLVGQDGTGNGTVVVDGADASGRSTAMTSADVYVGNNGRGTVTITNGAQFSAAGNFTAGFSGTGSGMVSVSGAAAGNAAQLSVGGSLSLGVSGGMGSLTIGNGGNVSVGGKTTIGGTGKGTITLAGGTLSTHGLAISANGVFAQNSGVLVINNGLYAPAGSSYSVVGTAGNTAELDLINGATLTQTGTLFIGGTSAGNGPGSGVVTLASNATANFSTGTRLWTNGTLNLAGGVLNTSSLTLSGGVFSFTSGGLILTNSNLTLGNAGILGSNLVLSNAPGSPNIVSVSGTTTFDGGSAITLVGGTFSTGKFIDNGVGLNFLFGTFAITNDNYTVGAGALLGPNMDLTGGQGFSVSGTVTINPGASLVLDGGTFSAGALVNNGSFVFNSGTIGSAGDLVLDPGTLLGQNVALSAGRNIAAAQSLIVGKTGSATLTLTGGGATSSRGYIGQNGGSSGVVAVSGTGAAWTLTGNLLVGGSDAAAGGSASLSISNGGAVNAGGTVTIYSTATTLVDNGTLGGVTVVNLGSLQLANAARVTGNVTNSSTLTKTGSGDAVISGTLSNASSVHVIGGTLTAAKGGGTSNGSFLVDLGATLEFGGAMNLGLNSSVFGANSSITGAGGVSFSSGAHVENGTLNISAATVSNASVTLNTNATVGHLTLAGSQTPSFGIFARKILAVQTLDFTGGDLGGTGTVTIGALNITGTAGKGLFQGTFNVSGASLWTGEASVTSINVTTLNNLAGAAFEVRNASTSMLPEFDSTFFNNGGSFVKSTGAGGVNMNTVFNNTGTVTLQNGALTFSEGGTHTGVFITSAGTMLTFNGNGGNADHTFLASSSVTAAGDVMFLDQAANFSGTYNVTGNSTFGGVLNFLSGAVIQSLGGALSVTGNASFSTGATLALPQTTLTGRLAGSDLLTVAGAFTWTTQSFDSTIDSHIQLNGSSTFTESGLYSKNLNGTIDNSGHVLWNNGTIVQQGVLNNQAGATFEIQGDGLRIDLASASPNPLPQINNSGTILKSTGNLTVIEASLDNSGSVQVLSGGLTFGGNSNSTGSFSVAQNTTVGFGFGTHTLQAASSITGAGGMLMDASQITIRGTVNITGPTSFGSQGDSNPAQITAEHGASLGNLGSDVTIWQNATVTLNTGNAVALHNLTVWGKLGGTDQVSFDGTLSGRGTITATTVNAGQLSPGASPGTLLIAGDYTQTAQAALNIELAPASLVGPLYIQQYDILDVNGNASLAGTLNLTDLNGFVPNIGDSFQILNYASHTGEFATILGQQPQSDRQYNLIYGNTGLTLTVVAAVPEPATLLVLGAGAGLCVLGRRRRKNAPLQRCPGPR